MDVRRILCPIDFSDVSTQALLQSARLAGWHHAQLVVLHVRPTVTPHPDLPASGAPAPWLAAELEALRQRVVDTCRAVIPTAGEVEPTAIAGDPVREILARAASMPADLIVIGTHGTSGFQRLVLGSVTEKVLRQARCPVLTVPPHAPTAPAPFSRILCAVDFSESSQAAAAYAASLARESGARLTLLHVLEWPWHDTPATAEEGVPLRQARLVGEYERYLESTAGQRLDALAASLGPAGHTATSIRFGKPYAELLEAATADAADLIVLGVHGRSALDIGFFGSTANQVVRSAACPVLTVRT